jgi:hypothetical protein
MANRQFPYTPELKPFQDADDAWSLELQRIFGKNAGDARYQERGKGAEGSELRRLHDERMIAQTLWHISAY